MKKTKVLLISPLPPPAGGIATWTEDYLEWSQENLLSVKVINTALVGNRANGINNKVNILEELRRTNNIIKSLKSSINGFKPEIIHLNTSCGKFGILRDFLCAKIARKSKVRLIIQYHCNIEDQIGDNILSKKILVKLSEIADVNLVLNKYSKKYLIQEANIKSKIIPNYINEEIIQNKSKNIKNKIDIISFVGHVQTTKGIREIIDVAKKKPEIQFKIAGPVSEEFIGITRPSNLIFLGSLSRSEVHELLKESDVFLFPSYTEGFSKSLLEAMAFGVPIIATPVGANADMIENRGGIIVKVSDTKDILDAIKILETTSLRLNMSKWNINKVLKHYTIKSVMNQLMNIYISEVI